MNSTPGSLGGAPPAGGMWSALAKEEARINDGWFPANPQLAAKIKDGFSSGRYEGDIDLLIEDVKSDISVFAYCLKRLIEIANQQDSAWASPDNPVDLIRGAAFDDLRSLLTAPADQISRHHLRDMNVVQAQRLRQSMASACVAESLCMGEGIQPELGYVTAIMRQLGLTLIAWNYPHLYQHARMNLTAKQTFDQGLSRVLGFTPSMLAISMARRWKLSPAIRLAIGDRQAGADGGDPAREALAERLAKICEIGEAFAQAAGGADYPLARGDWEEARQKIEEQLGSVGFEYLRERIFKAFEMYLNYAPHMFEMPEWEARPPVQSSCLGLALLTRNAHLAQCPARLRSMMERVYRSLDRASVSQGNIRTISREIIPMAGFPRGCVYLAELESGLLMPRLAVGTAKLNSFASVPCGVNSADRTGAKKRRALP
jgi:hypothetical protein